MRHRDRWVHPASLGSLARPLSESLGSSGIVWFTRGHRGGLLVHPESLGSFAHALGFVLGVVGLIRALGSFGSSGVVGFSHARIWARCVCPFPLGLFTCALRVDGLVQGHWVSSRASLGRWIHPGSLGSLKRSKGSLG